MKTRFLTGFAVVATAAVISGQVKYAPPRLPDGHPDLQGTYDLATLTPLERPGSDTAMKIGFLASFWSFLARDRKGLLLDLDLQLVRREPGDCERYSVRILAGAFDIIWRVGRFAVESRRLVQ